jgi:hypothetical protein
MDGGGVQQRENSFMSSGLLHSGSQQQLTSHRPAVKSHRHNSTKLSGHLTTGWMGHGDSVVVNEAVVVETSVVASEVEFSVGSVTGSLSVPNQTQSVH